MISNTILGNAIAWFETNSGIPVTPIAEWRKARNRWLRAQGVCGIIKAGRQSRSFPDWWKDGSLFWFDDSIDEEIFIDKWDKNV